ncbi:uncharacterized protein LOC134654878 [Cydia amplana]|uniref:uncharacterized protein LOC134654878 n=1 Tax=Cydia amplana TaxID=1869771 RepID=UPI002FE5700A
MGIENMRRWPMYLMFAVCILLVLSLLNSGSMLTVLRNRVAEMSVQLQECSKQQTSCMEESLRLLEQKDGYVSKLDDLDKEKGKLIDDIKDYKYKLTETELKVNRTKIDEQLCVAERESLKNLQLSKEGVIQTLRLEKVTLTDQLADRKKKIEDLEKQVENLKATLASMATKPAANIVSSKVTPAAQPPKLSPALNAHEPLNEPILDNDAKEDIDDTNVLNDDQGFDPQM